MNYLFFRRLIFTLSVCLVFNNSFAQQSTASTSALADYNKAVKLYQTKAYSAAEALFITAKKNSNPTSNIATNAFYYEALCAIKLNKTDAENKLHHFIDTYPNSGKINAAYVTIANFYFANKKPAYALKWYQKINSAQLSETQKKEINFKTGYCLLVNKKFKLAKDKFLPLLNDAKYGNDSRYYFGYASYKTENYKIAESTLSSIADNAAYKAEISYYLLDISFKSGNFKRCITVGLKLYNTVDKKLKSDVAKIIGESYFNLKQYAKAIPFLKAYKGKRGKWTNTDYYQLGYAYYKQNNYKNAINYFNKIIGQKNSVAQNAYYHLGESYLKIDKKSEALNAFKSASQLNFNNTIKEDAALNYAKLSYEAGNPFEPVATVLQNYLKAYPKSKAYTEINNLVVSSYVLQEDYSGALAFLENNKSPQNKILSLEIALYKGIELFNNTNFKIALTYFNKAQKSKQNSIRLKADYWAAETHYRLGNFKDAATAFKKLSGNLKGNRDTDFNLLDYNLGYSNFKLENYNEAITNFTNVLQLSSVKNSFKTDATLRLADAYYATNNHIKAIEHYKTVRLSNTENADYATFQTGMSLGLLNQKKEKINTLKTVLNTYKTSPLLDDALYEIGNTYTSLRDSKNANIAYNKLIAQHPKSVFVSRALLRQGLLYFNNGNNKKALDAYKKVVQDYPASADAFEAVANAKKVYIEQGNLDDFVSWTSKLNFIEITDAELDNSTFEIAEKTYFNSKDNNAILKKLNTYITKFPKGLHALQVTYYLAETYFKIDDFKKALPNYIAITNTTASENTEDALNKIAQIYLEQKAFKKALNYLLRLEEEANLKNNIIFAQSNLMQGYFTLKEYTKATLYAKKIMQNSLTTTVVKNDATLILARSAIKTNNFKEAQEHYAALEKTATGVVMAEALYYNAYFKNKAKAYEASNKVIQNVISKYAKHKYWGVKSYVIMGKNYYGLNDAYQATFVLENVIKNFKKFNDIIEDAKKELDQIKAKEAETNNSITSQKSK